MTVPLPSAYSPPYVEAAWYAWWEKQVSEWEGEKERVGVRLGCVFFSCRGSSDQNMG